MNSVSGDVNEWTLLTHPCFEEQFDNLLEQVEQARVKHPDIFQGKACTKLLSVVLKVVFEGILQNPSGAEYRQGNTLGPDYKHWRRAKFGAGRYRLFFRYSEKDKIIVLAWMNDEKTLRTYGSKSDAYRVFSGMINNGNPPDDWEALVEASNDSSTFLQKFRVVR